MVSWAATRHWTNVQWREACGPTDDDGVNTTGVVAGVRPAAPPGIMSADPYDFSVVLGGPLYQIVRRAHLSGDALELLRRRVVVISLFTWLPLLVLSIASGRAWGSAVAVPFFSDIEVHTRFLVALPLLII